MPGTAGPTTTHLPRPPAPPGPGAACHRPLSTTIPGPDLGTRPTTLWQSLTCRLLRRRKKAPAGTGPNAVLGPGNRARLATHATPPADQTWPRQPASDTASDPGDARDLADPWISIAGCGDGGPRYSGRAWPTSEMSHWSRAGTGTWRRACRLKVGAGACAGGWWCPPGRFWPGRDHRLG